MLMFCAYMQENNKCTYKYTRNKGCRQARDKHYPHTISLNIQKRLNLKKKKRKGKGRSVMRATDNILSYKRKKKRRCFWIALRQRSEKCNSQNKICEVVQGTVRIANIASKLAITFNINICTIDPVSRLAKGRKECNFAHKIESAQFKLRKRCQLVPTSANFPVHCQQPRQENLPHAATTNINTRHLNRKCQRREYSQPYKAKGRRKSVEPSPATAMRIQSHKGKREPTTTPNRHLNGIIAFGRLASQRR